MGLIDRLVARHDVASRYGIPLTASYLTMFCSALSLPLMVVTRSRLALLLPLCCLALLFLDLTLVAARGYHRVMRPYASQRWMTALHQVVGAEVMRAALCDLARRRGDPDPCRRGVGS